MFATNVVAVLGWVVLGAPVALAVTVAAARLLGVRRGWVALVIAGVMGWTLAVVAAGAITGWQWETFAMLAVAVALGTLFTMVVALGLDLLAPVGSLAKGDEAGLVTVANPVEGIRSRIRPLRRYRQVIGLARANGVATHRPSELALPTGVRQTLEQAGGMFVKLGQVASTRPDLLPPAWCEELAELRSRAEPAPADAMRAVLEQELGAPVEQVFLRFDWQPMASASIAQVYGAVLQDGTPVAVKVQRPGLDETVALDSRTILQLAGLIERRTAIGLAVRPLALAEEFIANVKEELDFRIEAANARAIADALAGTPGIRVPVVMPTLSTQRVITEERINGQTIADVTRLRALGLDPSEIATRLLASFLHQIFEAGVFHSDPHPGNILVEDDGTIVLIDLGAVGHLGVGQRALVLQLLSAASAADATGVRQALTQMTVLDPRADLRELDFALDDLLGRHMRSGGGITADAFQDLTLLVGRYGIHLPRWFGTLSRTMVTLEGTLRSIDPRFSLVDAAHGHAAPGVVPAFDRASIRGLLEHEAMVQLPRLQRLPERIDELLGQAVDGRISAQLSLFAHEHDERVIRSLVDRVVIAVLAAMLGVGSVLLLDVEAGPALSESVSINEILGYLGLASASILTLRVIAGVIRDGLF